MRCILRETSRGVGAPARVVSALTPLQCEWFWQLSYPLQHSGWLFFYPYSFFLLLNPEGSAPFLAAFWLSIFSWSLYEFHLGLHFLLFFDPYLFCCLIPHLCLCILTTWFVFKLESCFCLQVMHQNGWDLIIGNSDKLAQMDVRQDRRSTRMEVAFFNLDLCVIYNICILYTTRQAYRYTMLHYVST